MVLPTRRIFSVSDTHLLLPSDTMWGTEKPSSEKEKRNALERILFSVLGNSGICFILFVCFFSGLMEIPEISNGIDLGTRETIETLSPHKNEIINFGYSSQRQTVKLKSEG